jgi:DNA polymerase III subunit beta
MKLSCVRENLVKALSSLSRVVTVSSTLPILGNILIKTDQGRLKLSATDLGMGINYWIGASVEEEGEITLPARTFVDYVTNNTDGHIRFEVEGQVVNVSSEHHSTKINGLSSEEFPIIPRIEEEARLEVSKEALQDALSKVVLAAAVGEMNPTLAGVLLKTEDNILKVVATDSYRLAEKVIGLKEAVSDNFAVIVPTKTVAELNKLLGQAEGVVKLKVSENQIMFQMDNIEVISRLVEGNYPAYESLMPTNFSTKVTVGTKELLSDVKMAAVFSRETQKIKLMINKETKEIISVAKGQSGENISKTSVEVEGVDGEIVFNTRYIMDVLNVVGTPKVVIELTDKLKPGLVKGVGDDNYRYLIMPVKD